MMTLSHQFGRKLLGCGSVGLALACSACATVPQTARSNSAEQGPIQAIYKEAVSENSPSKTDRKNRASDIQQLNAVQPSAAAPVRRDSAIQQIAYSDESATYGSAYPAIDSPTTQPVSAIQNSIESCPPEPRFPAAGPNPLAPGMMACDVCNMPSTEKYADEYLCDGGDRDLPVHYDAFSRRSLDTEDTVLEYTDRAGHEKMKPSNQVCIYAPRFSSVRTVTRPHEEFSMNEVAGIGHLASTKGVHTRLKASNEVKREMTGGIAVRSRASGLQTDAGQDTVTQLRSPSAHDKLLNIYQAMTFVRSGRLEDTDTARLNLGIQAASAWTRQQYPVVSSKTDMALEGHFEQSIAAITCIEEREEAENLRIVKLANKKTAVSGDEIEFTIRYDNLGGREVHHIRVVDNLTPRLEYIDDSATSDRAGRLVLQDNGEGSQILIWEIDEPLKGKTGGVVTFKVRVR